MQAEATEWRTAKVRDLGDVQLGRQRSPGAANGPNQTPYLRVANVYDGYIDYADVLSMSFSEAERRVFYVRAGDILLNEGQSLELVGRSALYEGPPDTYCIQNTLVRFRCGDALAPAFARAMFKRWMDIGKFAQIAKQTTSIAHLGAGRFAALDITLPPLAEQRRISDILDILDRAIRRSEQVIAKLRQVKRGLAHDLLTRGIDENGLAGVAMAGRGCKFVEVGLADLVTPVREPGRPHLPVVSVTMNAGLVERDPTQRRVLTELAPEQHLLVRRGDIAYNMMRMWQGACGLAEVDCLVSPAYVVLRMNSRLVPEFAYLLFKSPELIAAFLKHSRGITSDRYRLYPQDLLKIQVSIPEDVTIQRHIANALDRLHDRIVREQEAVAKLHMLKSGLSRDLLTGGVRVPPPAQATV